MTSPGMSLLSPMGTIKVPFTLIFREKKAPRRFNWMLEGSQPLPRPPIEDQTLVSAGIYNSKVATSSYFHNLKSLFFSR